jgi:hypothetical protein
MDATAKSEARAGALDGRVALVAGATRGAGRAIAVELARAGASTRPDEAAEPATWPTRARARTATVHWLEAVYNRQRRHSAIDMQSPVDYEERLLGSPRSGLTQVSTRPGQDHPRPLTPRGPLRPVGLGAARVLQEVVRHSELRAGEGPTRTSAVARLRSPHAGAI